MVMTAGVSRQDKTDTNDSIGKDRSDYDTFSSEAGDATNSKSSTVNGYSIRQRTATQVHNTPKASTSDNKTNSFKYDDIFFSTRNKD